MEKIAAHGVHVRLLYGIIAVLGALLTASVFAAPDRQAADPTRHSDVREEVRASSTPAVLGEAAHADDPQREEATPAFEGALSTVTKVVDGDTIAISKGGATETIRLIGINTPETVDPRRPAECFGKEASDAARALLEGVRVRIETDSSQGERDRYGRLLAYVFREDGLFVNKVLIERGYAYEYTYAAPYAYQQAFKTAQATAQRNGSGLWAADACATAADASPAPETIPVSVAPGATVCSRNTYNCTHFKTRAEAQAVYDSCGGAGNDIHKLDSDGDGEACETLP